MSTIKSDRVDFEKLLNGLDPVVPHVGGVQTPDVSVQASSQQQTATSVVDNAPAAQMMNEPLFTFDYEAERKGIRKKCRKTILGIVNHVIPPNMIEDEYIQDKIEQDIETLTELYMQAKLNSVMQRANVEMTARGNYTARNTEVFGQLTDKMQSINKQIFDTEQRIRKTYLDLKYEIRDKQGEDFALGVNVNNSNNMIGGPTGDGGLLVTSTKDLIAGARARHLQNVKEAKAIVVE